MQKKYLYIKSKIKSRKKNIFYKVITFLLAVIISFSSALEYSKAFQKIKDGYYKVDISLMKKYDDEASMGNNALKQYAIVEVSNGKIKMKLRFLPLQFMGFTGYLSNFEVKNRKVNIISQYDNYDIYNDPINGKNEKYKGVKYPKDMEFDISADEDTIPVKVYVPVMAELGSGEQEARLKINWPKEIEKCSIKSNDFDNQNEFNGNVSEERIENQEQALEIGEENAYKDNRKLPKLEKGEKLNLEDGYYEVNVSLYHEREDKPSMGNGAMVNKANILSKEGKYHMIVASNKMTVQNITASLVSFQVRDDNEYYYFSKAYAYDLEIEGESQKRPRVFEFSINRKDPMIYVKVDPKVKPMGEVPIGARLKIDWSSLRQVEESKAELYEIKKKGTPKKTFNPNDSIDRLDDGIRYRAPKGTFTRNVRFKLDKIFGGKEYLETVKKLGRSTKFDIYSFSAEDDFGKVQKNKNPVSITMKKGELSGIPIRARYIDDLSEIATSVKGDEVTFKLSRLGKIAIIYEENNSSKKPIIKASGERKKANIQINKDKNSSPSRSIEKSKKETSKSANLKNKNDKKDESEKKSNLKGNPPVTTLTNDNQEFNKSIEENDDKNENTLEENNEKLETQENLKVIFFGIMAIVMSVIAAIYVYINIGKKLLYEIDLSKKLKEIINKGDII